MLVLAHSLIDSTYRELKPDRLPIWNSGFIVSAMKTRSDFYKSMQARYGRGWRTAVSQQIGCSPALLKKKLNACESAAECVYAVIDLSSGWRGVE
jgi:hypothetical protein